MHSTSHQASDQKVRWLYLDMNSYFASVEQEMNPSLRGKPIAVVPLQADTTCCIAVSYEGKAFGVKTGTRVDEAKKLCPKMIFIEGKHENYIRYHNKIVEAVESCLPIQRVCSIDEMACKLTGSQQDVTSAQTLSDKIKATLKYQVGITLKCSIGVAPNRYLAKIAADQMKPNGFTVIRPCDLPKVLYRMHLRDLPGIGMKMEKRLNSKNIYHIEQLCSMTPLQMKEAWGSSVGQEIWYLLRGEEQLEAIPAQKSIGHSHVLPPELRHKLGAQKVLKKLMTKLALRLRRAGLYASHLQIYVKFLGAEAWKAKCGLIETQDTFVFIRAMKTLCKQLPTGSLYAVGVVLSGLVSEALHTPSLFDDPRRKKLTQALDKVNEKFGKNMIHVGAIHESEELAPLRIAFTRIPDEDCDEI
jgi:DNA polymerase IV